jgi:vitamin-K-epoxide reductase (warfarin-sensitive)
MKRSLIHWIIGFALVGVALSTYSLLHKTGFTSGALCNLNDTFSCDIVNQGPYSEMFGIPVAAIGLIGYGLVLAAAIMKKRNPSDRGLSTFLLASTAAGFLFALYLTSLEAFVLYAWCIVCTCPVDTSV